MQQHAVESTPALAGIELGLLMSRATLGNWTIQATRKASLPPARFPDRTFMVLLGLFIALQFYLGLGVKPVRTPDSAIFSSMATEHSIFSRNMLAGARPPLTSFVLRTVVGVGGGDRLFVVVQWLFHIVAWSALSAFVYARSRYRLTGIILATWVLSTALLPQVHIWNFFVLSESIFLSCLPLLFLGLFLLFRGDVRRRSSLFLAAVLAAGVLARDLGAYLALSIGISVFVATVLVKSNRRKPYLLLATATIGFVFTAFTADIGGPKATDKRWIFPFFNVIAQRILPDTSLQAEFSRRGMPVSESLKLRANTWASSDGFAFFNDPELASFRDWSTSRGSAVYRSFLLANPGFSIGRLMENRRTILHEIPAGLAGYYPDGYPGISEQVFKIEARLLWWALPFVLALMIALWQRRNGVLPDDKWRLASVLATFLPVPVLMFVSYHGDAMEVSRHSVPTSVYLRLWFVCAAFLVLDTSEHSMN